ncbi:MAG: carboxylating nicotinate-nucleotide diphosphorylase [Verrucomicrobiota bacterium]
MAAHYQGLIEAALSEDLGEVGDLTSRFFIPASSETTARMVAREPCVIAGIELAREVFLTMDDRLEVSLERPSGSEIGEDGVNREAILTISGATRSILTAERVALNFAQRLSGVATLTRKFVDRVEGTAVRILDTRKTTPGWRALEKEAVRMGGGYNHRMGLYDRVMVKDNHLAAESGGLEAAIRVLKAAHPEVGVELEADTLEQVERFLELEHVEWILLDNMSLDELRAAVRLGAGKAIELEASGGVNLDTVRGIAETGVDCISVGALTHSAGSVDLSLDMV